MRMALTVAIGAAGLVGLGAPRPAAESPQIPAQFKNLQVLPKDITRPQLVQIMRQMASDLGGRCTTCHVGPDNLEGMDFATDEKRAKQVARTMLRMVQTINADFVRTIPGGPQRADSVTCATCHRRSMIPPRPLAALVLDLIADKGVDAALAEHRRLRDESLDSGLYDFRLHTLNQVATRLREEKKIAEAVAVLKRNVDLFPQSANALVALGDTAALVPDLALAEASYRKALQLDPKHDGALRGLAAIKR